MSQNKKPYDVGHYFAMALDPIHVGAGGYRLGRVDLSIVREPGTEIPKIPGSSISGACRAYTAMQTGRYRWEKNGKIYTCAGQGQEDTKKHKPGHCGQHDCPVCTTFGFAKKSGGGFRGLAAFGDVHILFFPVYSMVGPVWITSPSRLRNAAGLLSEGNTLTVASNTFRLIQGFDGAPGKQENKRRMNFGWLMLEEDSGGFTLPEGLTLPNHIGPITKRLVLLSDKLFSQIVNDNLEVRTSVSIDPATGAAEEGALFTYEAIPRSTVLWFDVVYHDKRFFRVNGREPTHEPRPEVEKGLRMFEHLGVGGMGTRGMGRLRVFNLNDNSAGGGER